MGYIFNFHDACAYERWFAEPANRPATEMGIRLMCEMINPHKGTSLLNIGCGTGHELLPVLDMGIEVSNIDPSPYMIDITLKTLQNRSDYHRGFAESLPFDDNSFNYVSIISTLEFVNDYVKTIEEACRVAKDRVYLGIFNKLAIKDIQLSMKYFYSDSVCKKAHLYTIWELKRTIRQILGDVPIEWKSVLRFPATPCRKKSRSIEKNFIMDRFPFGAFVGIAITPVPRFKTRPLSMKYSANVSDGAFVS
ncbi:MAG: class I SAM-dependent methyltransferase [Desulfobacterales bacterium]|nr:class I SAM-dependent methyltransferase [Desulfobacterales bacterium]